MSTTDPIKNQSFLDACRGLRPDRTPIWMMRQAGRYLPEYREVRSKMSFLELCRTPEMCAEVTVQPIDRFGLDAAILFSDILVVFDAMGVEVDFTPSPVVANPVRTAADAKKLRFGDPREDLGYVFDAVRACKEALNQRVPLIGFCGAPLTTLSYLVEGKGSRDFHEIKKLMFSEPDLFRHLMASTTELLGKYLIGQIDAGVDAVQIFDSWASALGTTDYKKHVLPHNQRLIEIVKPHGVPVIMFARGNADLLTATATTPADVIGVDWSMDMNRAIELVGPDKVVQGNLDPALLLSTPEALRQRTIETLKAGRKAKSHIFNLGHGISRYTDPEMAKVLVDTVHDFKPDAD